MATKNNAEVGLETKAGKIRLRLPRSVADGSSRYISTGLTDTTENHKKAQVVAWAIEEDIRNNSLDVTLERYKQQFRPKQQVTKTEVDLLSLWLKYAEYKRPQLAPTTLTRIYLQNIPNHIQRFPSQKLTDALIIRDYLLANVSVVVTKIVISNLCACCKWAVKSGFITSNPFVGMAADIRKPKRTREIKPFTKEERETILEAFRQHKPHYLPFVSFMFLTGCRPGEAVALQWKHISQDCTSITFAESCDSQLKIRKTTKTGVTRKFPCNQQLQALLVSIRPAQVDPEAVVFTRPRGQPMHQVQFVNNVWKGRQDGSKYYAGVVMKLAKVGAISSYRCLYNTRHTFISHCLEAGVPVTTIAKWVGNSPEILMRHYAGVTKEISVPEL
ncbi:site-specific integrase [Nostoc linckia FACHB-104]|nr:site-specific integrase [Nostoc linckia FACHB-104]